MLLRMGYARASRVLRGRGPLDIADDIHTCLGDERKIQQILVDLLSNAVKFTPERSDVHG
jgi:signal transduction histidine kinase